MPQLDKGIIGIRQFTVIVILLTLGDSILILPSGIAGSSHQDAWIAGILGLVFGLVAVWIFSVMGGFYPGLSLIQYTPLIAGKWLGIVLNLSFLIYFGFIVVSVSWEIGDFITSVVMPETPIEVIELLFYGMMVFAARLGIGPIIRASEIFFPWVMLTLFVLIVMLIPQMQLNQIQPILEKGIKPILLGTLHAGSFPYMEIFAVLIILPHIKQSQEIRKNFLIGALLGGIALNMVLAQSIFVLGEYLTAHRFYSSFALAQRINIANFFQRLETIIAFLWIITTYVKTTLYFYVLNVGLAQFLKLKEYKMLTVPTSMICYALIFISIPNASFFNAVLAKVWAFYNITICMIIPLLLVGIYFIRNNKLKRSGGKTQG
ncbi:endospore germination permease [Paenibacillus alba]|uniref:endospore germination permease n=1 Tax=Paenibacillus alba TaxID=1197127 RepID=UPI0015649E55|nr:endospore germination permease [Paenibacillus alba]